MASPGPDSSNHSASDFSEPQVPIDPLTSSDDQMLPGDVGIPPEDALPSDLESIPIDEGIIHIPLDNEDYDIPSDYSTEEEDESDDGVILDDSQSDYVVEYDDDDDDGELEQPPRNLGTMAENIGSSDDSFASVGRQNIENHLRQKITVQKFGDKFPLSNAGVPITSSHSGDSPSNLYNSNTTGSDSNPYAPFADHMNWEIAHWAKLRGPGSTAVSELLSIDQVSIYSVLLFFSEF